MAEFGIRPEDHPAAVIEIWPDNQLATDVFLAMATQWRVGAGGATGLDYGVLPTVMRLAGVQRTMRADTFDAVRVMEGAALRVMHANRSRKGAP